MFSKSTLFLAFVAVARFATAATPPACFLASINTQQTLNDYEGICGNKAGEVQNHIQTKCSGDNVKAALDAFASACKGKGHSVASATPVSSGASRTGSATASPSATGTGVGTGTSPSGNNATATGGSGSGSGSGSSPTGLTTLVGTGAGSAPTATGPRPSTTSGVLQATGAASVLSMGKGAVVGAVVFGLAGFAL